MPDRTDIAYLYDGSYEGFLCCVFESFDRREIPADILAEAGERLTLFPTRFVPTDGERARRVRDSIPRRICVEAAQTVFAAYCSCLPRRESRLLDFLRLGYRIGAKALTSLADPQVNALVKAAWAAQHEAHLLSGFVRFSDHGGLLSAVIEPKNRVLPLFADHFADRYRPHPLFIYDKTHAQALAAHDGRWQIAPLADFTPAPPDAKEREMRALWRTFYDTIAIEGRENPKCRMTHMPKRFWQHMTEFQPDDVSPALNGPPSA